MLWWILHELKSSNWETRWRSVQKLGNMKDQRAIEALVGALQDKQPLVRYAAEEALEKVDPDWVKSRAARANGQTFAVALNNPDKDVRKAAAEVLGMIQNRDAVDSLIEALSDTDAGVRKAVVEALGMIADKKSVEPLVAKLRDSDDDVRRSVTFALWKIGDKRAIAPLIEELSDQPRNVREAAAEALAYLQWSPSNKIEQALYAVARRDWEKASTFGEIAIEPLVAALQDWDKEIQESAVKALGRIRSAKAVEPLIIVLKHWDRNVRLSAATALGLIGGSKAIDALGIALQDNDSKVRESAVKALGETKLLEATKILIGKLNDKETGVRKAIAEALGKIGSLEAINPLIGALMDEDSDVRECVAESLSMLNWEPSSSRERALYSIARRNWDEVISYGPIATEFLIRLLMDRQKTIRLAVVYVLGQIKDTFSIEPLLNMLRTPRIEVRQAVVETLGKLGAASAISQLIKLTDDSQIADRTVGAIRQILEQNASNVKPEDLNEIARLNNVVQLYQNSHNLNEDETIEPIQIVDCSLVKQLARNELAHRLKASRA